MGIYFSFLSFPGPGSCFGIALAVPTLFTMWILHTVETSQSKRRIPEFLQLILFPMPTAHLLLLFCLFALLTKQEIIFGLWVVTPTQRTDLHFSGIIVSYCRINTNYQSPLSYHFPLLYIGAFPLIIFASIGCHLLCFNIEDYLKC